MLIGRSWVPGLRRAGAAATLAALPVAAAGTLTWAADGLLGAVRAPGPAAVDRLVALGAAAACGVTLATVALGAALTGLVALLGRVAGCGSGRGQGRPAPHRGVPVCVNGVDRLAGLVTPGLVRRLAGVALGVSLAGATVGPADAASAAPRASQHAAVADATVDRPAGRAPGWSLDRPASPRRGSTAPGGHLVTTAPGGPRPADIVVVRPGDTLWDIAARTLGRHATAREVAAAWPRWYRANRRTIGADAGLLRPGQRLRPPTALDRSPTDASSPDPVTREEEP